MKHARQDYNRIQDPENKIPKDEPVFLLRAQDVNAPIVLEYWADLSEKERASGDIVAMARVQAAEMRIWQQSHGCKIPDL